MLVNSREGNVAAVLFINVPGCESKDPAFEKYVCGSGLYPDPRRVRSKVYKNLVVVQLGNG